VDTTKLLILPRSKVREKEPLLSRFGQKLREKGRISDAVEKKTMEVQSSRMWPTT
jgi:hypothetical protein